MKGLFTITIILATMLLQASGTFSLIEINPLHGNSPLTLTTDSAKTYYGAGALTGFTAMNGKLYFSAQGAPGDDELWVTDGTQQGTKVVKEINPNHGAGLGNLVLVNNRILFMASDNGSTWDLWSSDGTDSGTVKIDTLNQPTNNALGYDNFSWIGNKILFCTTEKLLLSDGTYPGTTSILSIANYSQGFGYCEMNGQSYFILPEISGDYEIWKTDGTDTGTQVVIDLADAPYNITDAGEVVSFNGKIYLSGTDSGQLGADLYEFDGNVNGQLNKIAVAHTGNANPHGFNLYNNSLYFIATDGAMQNVYRISNTDSTPTPLLGNGYTSLSNLTLANNSVYCMDSANNQIHAVELSGFTTSALSLTGYRLPFYPYKNRPFMLWANQQMFFEAYDSTTGNQLFMESNFTTAGTQPVMPAGANTQHPFNSLLGSRNGDVFDLNLWGSEIILPANFNDAGRELWLFDPSGVNGIKEAKNDNAFAMYPNPASDGLTVKTTICNNCVQELSMMDITGHVLLKQAITEQTTVIRLSAFAAGNYLITLRQDGNITNTSQLVLVK